MTKERFFNIALIVVIVLALLNTALAVVGKHENHKRANETHTLALETHTLAGEAKKLAVENHNLALSNCQNIGALAAIQRSFINRQELQTQALLKGGITFGIPPARIPGLIAASKASQELFLAQLDALASRTCVAQAINAPLGKVGEAAPPTTPTSPTRTAPAGRPQTSNRTLAPAPSQRPASPSPRTLPERPTRTVTTPGPAASAPSAATAPTTTAPQAPPASAPAPAPVPAPPTAPPIQPPLVGLPCVRIAVVSTC